jgi:Ca2+-binding EF-hand superfamily protein
MRALKLLLPLLLLGLALTGVQAEDAAAASDGQVPEHSDEEIQEAKEEFESIDTNKDGFITREEILEMDEVPERDEIDEFFNTYDKDADGRVTFEEILNADAELRQSDAPDKEL